MDSAPVLAPSFFREGPFDAATPHPRIGNNQGGCAYRFTTHRDYDYAIQDGLFDVQINHPQFLEWVGAQESARLLGREPGKWIRSLTQFETLDAVRQLQRDACLMTSNLSVLDQYGLSLHGTASDMLKLVAGCHDFLCGYGCRRTGPACLACFHTHGGYGPLAPSAWSWRWPLTSSIRALRVPVVLPVCRECPVGNRFFSFSLHMPK